MAKPRSKPASAKKPKNTPTTKTTDVPDTPVQPSRAPIASASPDFICDTNIINNESDATSTMSHPLNTSNEDNSRDWTPIQSPIPSQSNVGATKRKPGPKSKQGHDSIENDDEAEVTEYPTPDTSVTDESNLQNDQIDGNNGTKNDELSLVSSNGENSDVNNSELNGRRRKQSVPKKSSMPSNRNLKLALEIAHLQVTTKTLLQKAPFQRVVRDIMAELGYTNYRITLSALNALQESTELYLTQFFEDAYACCLHRGRVTLSAKDMQLIKFLRRHCFDF